MIEIVLYFILQTGRPLLQGWLTNNS